MRVLFKAILGLSMALMLSVAAHAAAVGGPPIRILALGDSLTQGFGVPPGAEFPVRLEAALRGRGFDVTLINGGVSGDTSAGGLSRLDWLLSNPGQTPDAAIVELGANDGLRGLPPGEMEKNLDSILGKLKARAIPVLLTGMKAPRNLGTQYASEFDAVFPRLAEKYGVLFDPFFLDGVALDPSLLQADGLHPNPKGVDAVVRRIVPLAVELVQQATMLHARGAPSAQ